MPYTPNATQTTEPTSGQTVVSAALEFRTLKASVNSRIDALQVEVDAEEVTRAAADSALNVRTTALEQLAFNGSTPGTVTVTKFVATASQTVFTLPVTPLTVATVDVYINGIYQNHDSFNLAGNVVTLNEGVIAGAEVEIQASIALQLGVTSADLIQYQPAGAGAVATTVQSFLREDVFLTSFATAQAAFTAAAGKTLRIPAGTHNITGEIAIPSNIRIVGDGQGVTILNFQKATNPVSSEFMLAARRQSNITIENLTLTSNAYADGLFNVGTYTAGPPKKYSGGDAGNINGLLISSCTDVIVRDVEVRYFNHDGIRVSVEGGNPTTDYNKRLTFDRVYGHHCLSTPLDILGTMDFKVVNSTFTDNGNFTASYIDGAIGYGVVLGRTPSGTQLRSFGGLCANNFCARNARHGIDSHAGANLIIEGNVLEDNLIMGVCVMDIAGSADDSYIGDVTVRGNTVYHTSWVVSQYPLLTYRDDGSERDDSVPIFVSRVGGSLLQNATIEGNDVRGWRYRQLVANTTADLVGTIFCSVVKHAKVIGNNVEATNAAYYPSVGLEVECNTFDVSGNSWNCTQRSTVSKPFWKFDADYQGIINANHFQLTNVYSDSATTQAAYPTFRKIAGDLVFTGNTIVQTGQGTRGGLWYDTGTNQKYGFNGILSVNQGNQLYAGGATLIEYASRINGALTVYLSDAGSGRFDGLSSGNRFVATNAAQFLAILNDMPRCESGMVVMIDTDQLDWGSDAGVTIPDWQDNITFRGLSSETANSMTKTGGIKTTGGALVTCPERSQNINFEHLYMKSSGTHVLYRPANVKYCAIEGTSNGQIGVYCEYKSSYVRSTRFKGPGAGTSIAIGAFLGANIVSQANDSDAAAFAYGLNANGAAIRKNSTQPTGATANELTQNGGTIA